MVENQVDVAALREGVIVSILAEPNTRVRKGQLLARLDDRQISADLDAASAKTRSIQANLKNWEAETKVLESDLAARKSSGKRGSSPRKRWSTPNTKWRPTSSKSAAKPNS